MKTQHMMILAVLLIAVMICGYVIGACMPPPAYANTLPAAGTNNLQNAGINTPENHSIKVIGMIGGVSWLSSA